jgi:hypothetical protein
VIDESRVLETATVAPWLTGLPSKRTIFADDLYFWEGWAAFVAACSREPDETLLRHLTFVLMKPEATVGRRFDPILDFLLGKGFSIAGARPASSLLPSTFRKAYHLRPACAASVPRVSQARSTRRAVSAPGRAGSTVS